MSANPIHRSLRAVIAISIFGLIFKFGAGLHYSLLSTLGERVLPVWAVGIVVGFGSLLQLVLDVPAGMALDRFGYVRLLRMFTFVFILGSLALVAGLTVPVYLATVLLATLGWLFYGPGTSSYVLAESPKSAAGHSMGTLHAFQSGGVVLSAIALPFVVLWSAERTGFLIAGILAIALISLFAVPPESASVHAERKIKRHHYYIRRHGLRRIIAAVRRLNPASTMFAIQSFAGAFFYGIIWFAVPLAIASGLAGNLPGFSLSVFDLAIVVFGAFFGKLADRWDRRALVFGGLFVFSAAGILLGLNFNIWFLIIGFIATAGDELSAVSLWAWLDDLDATHAEDGLVNGAITLFEDLGWTLGPIAAGFLYASWGPAWAITLGASVLCAAWLSSFFLLRHPSARRRGAPAPFAVPHRARHKR